MKRCLASVATLLLAVVLPACGRSDPGPVALTSTQPAPDGALTFAGWHWQVKAADEPVGPGPNRFGRDNVSLDEQGRLHLRIAPVGDGWTSAEVFATESMGYGTYTWRIDAPGTPYEPNAVLGLFTWSDDPAMAHREIDIELSRFRRGEVSGQHVVQPHAVPGNLRQFTRPDGPLVASFTWRPGTVRFSVAGAEPAEWDYVGGGVPPPGGAVHPRINLWLLAGDAPMLGQPVEVVISGFTFVPLQT